MNLPICLAVLSLCIASTVNADVLACIYGCSIPLQSLQFVGDSPDQSYYMLLCQNKLRVQSMYLCLRDRCTSKEFEVGVNELGHECEEDGKTSLLPESIIENITKQDESHLAVIYYDDLTLSGNLDAQVYQKPVLLSDDLFALSFKTKTVWDAALSANADYSYALYGFWGIVLLLGFCNRFYSLLAKYVHRSAASDHTKSPRSRLASLKLWIGRHISHPALTGHHAAEPLGWCTIPPRLQSTTLFLFLIVNIVLCCASYRAFPRNLYWPETRTQIWRYLSDRTGCLAMANMPLIWVFAVRNNVLLWLTGWSFTTFNQFHRWVSRIATVEAVVHSVGYTVEVFLDGGKAEYDEYWSERWWYMGIVATIVMCLICGFSIYPMRKLFYEVFLLTHIALAIVFLIGMYYHVKIFDGEYNPYIWPCVAVWAFDRLLRICRILFINDLRYNSTVSYEAAANVIRLQVPVRHSVPLHSGTHYFIYVCSGLKFWESHPFSLSSWTGSETEASKSSTKHISFLIRPHDSFTRRLRSLAEQVKDTERPAIYSSPVKVIVEGPYGTPHRLQDRDSVLFIIGGSGISVTLAHIRTLYDGLGKTKANPIRRIHLVWIIRDFAFFQEVFNNELTTFWFGEHGLASKLETQIDVYVTGGGVPASSAFDHNPTHPSSSDLKHLAEPEPPKIDEKISTLPQDVNLYHFRPHVEEIVISNARQYATEGNSMVLVSCGPHSMADDVRAGVVDALGKGCDGLEFRPELFNW